MGATACIVHAHARATACTRTCTHAPAARRYGDELHLDEALDKIFRFGKSGGVPRKQCPILKGGHALPPCCVAGGRVGGRGLFSLAVGASLSPRAHVLPAGLREELTDGAYTLVLEFEVGGASQLPGWRTAAPLRMPCILHRPCSSAHTVRVAPARAVHH